MFFDINKTKKIKVKPKFYFSFESYIDKIYVFKPNLQLTTETE